MQALSHVETDGRSTLATLPPVAVFSYLGFSTLFVGLMIVWRYSTRAPDTDAIRMYVVSAALTAAGAIVDVLRYVSTRAFAVAISLDLTLLAQLTALVATRRLHRRGPTPRPYFILTAAGCFAASWFTLIEPNYQWRIGAYMATGAVLTGSIAWLFLRASEPGLTAIFRLIGSIYGAYAVLSIARLATLPRADPTSTVDFEPTSVLLNQLGALPMLFLMALMLVIVSMRRAHAATEEDLVVAVETSADLLADTWADPLTGLASRARIRSVLESLLAITPHDGPKSAVVVVALDGPLVEMHGHSVADDALIAMAEQVRSRVGVGALDWDSAGRWGENSVIVILPAGSSQPNLQRAESLASAVQSLTTASGHACTASVAYVGISPGTSLGPLETSLREATSRALDLGPAGFVIHTAA